MYREGKANGLHNFPETAADAANGSIYCRTLVDGNKVLRVLLLDVYKRQRPKLYRYPPPKRGCRCPWSS